MTTPYPLSHASAAYTSLCHSRTKDVRKVGSSPNKVSSSRRTEYHNTVGES